MSEEKIKMTKEFIKICPQCGSNNVTSTSTLIGAIGNFSTCKSCGYGGVFPEIEKDKVEKFKKMLRRQK